MMNVHSHATFVLVRDQLSADPEDPLLKRHKGNCKGITAKKRFLLDVTRAVIERSIRRIRADPRLWDPSTDTPHSKQKVNRAAEIAKFAQAGAPQSPPPAAAEAKAGSSGRPRKPRPHAFSSKGFNGKLKDNNPQKCMHVGSDGRCGTRTRMHCPGCRVFLCPKHRANCACDPLHPQVCFIGNWCSDRWLARLGPGPNEVVAAGCAKNILIIIIINIIIN